MRGTVLNEIRRNRLTINLPLDTILNRFGEPANVRRTVIKECKFLPSFQSYRKSFFLKKKS